MGLDAIGIVCENIPESIRFYKMLGITVQPMGGSDHYEGQTRNGLRLMLDSVELMRKLNPDWQKPVGSGVVLCFGQESAESVDRLFKDIVDAGFSSLKEPWDAFWGQRYCSVADPDGTQIDIYALLS